MKVLGYLVMAVVLVCIGVLIYAGCTDQTFLDVFNSIFGITPAEPTPEATQVVE